MRYGDRQTQAAYDGGRLAALQRRPRTDNPHEKGPLRLRSAWDTGYEEATKEREND